ncbi:venom metalloproteinase antarease-like TserMP_B [Haemaphysalis longicornis]
MSKTENPYIVRPHGRPEKALDEETLAAFNKYYKNKDVYKRADLMFLITGEDLTFYEHGTLQTWTGGYTYIGGICQDYKVGLSEDYPTTFYNVYTVSHEIGHSLGCVHDGSGPVRELPGHRGSTQCRWDEGYIMSYDLKDERQYTFSECCRRDMENLLSQRKWGCLSWRAHRSIKQRVFPGQHTSGEKYCQGLYSYDKSMHYDRVYGVQHCQVHCQGTSSYYLGVPDGTPCDQKRTGEKKCMLGKCWDYKTWKSKKRY